MTGPSAIFASSNTSLILCIDRSAPNEIVLSPALKRRSLNFLSVYVYRVLNSKNQCQPIQAFSGAIDSPKW